MADTWGNRVKLTIFGESHGPAVGVVIDGLPAGMVVDREAVAFEMARRAPGGALSTARREADAVEICSGLYQGLTSGSALCGLIRNTDARSGDYGDIPRPGHADMTAAVRYGGFADMRGGGHFSGRLTAPLVFAGALAKQALAPLGLRIYGCIVSIGEIIDESKNLSEENRKAVLRKDFPVMDEETGRRMRKEILLAKEAGDSVGGTVEVAALGVPAGWGDPFFDSVESRAASLFFSIPAVKGVEFGRGFALSRMRGSEANDPIIPAEDGPGTASNHCGGILGGITTGGEVTARVAFKPTPSIALPQRSVDPKSGEAVQLAIRGRHDPCIVPRALPVVEAALALALLDCMR